MTNPYILAQAWNHDLAPHCKLSHDILNKLCAIIGNCDELEAGIPSPWCIERTAKINDLAQQITEMLRSSECACGSNAQQ